MERGKMKKVWKYLLLAVMAVGWSLLISTSALAAGREVKVNLTSVEHVKIYTEDKETEIPVTDNSFSVEPGKYCYESDKGAGGYFTVTEETTELKLSRVSFKAACLKDNYGHQLGNVTAVYDETRENTFWHETEDTYTYLVPRQDGDHYYNFVYEPFDSETYMNSEGHFYVYTDDLSFDSLNLSDSGKIALIKKQYAVVKVPKEAEVLTYWELKFYTARNWQTYTAYKTDDTYSYYKIPKYYLTAGNSGILVRQEGKVSRYGLKGEWNADRTEFTMADLLNDPHQTNEGVGTYYASMLNNLPPSSEIDLKVGEYFDLVPLRAWQAISNGASNEHCDPEWHYAVVGGSEDIVSTEITEDDKIGQFGRIRANGTGTALVAFWYDAMEAPNDTSDPNYLWSALWPEITGIAVIHVTEDGAAEPDTKIDSNIEVTEGKTIYYLRNQTMEDGTTVHVNDTAEYTFKPTATTGETDTKITSVRVHTPIMAKNGVLTQNPSDWLKDKSWKTYKQNADGTYTLSLPEGKSIIEIKAGDAVAYHVIWARGMDVQIDNLYNAGQKLACNDTAKITMKGLIPPVFKMGAIYNPSGVTFHYQENGVEKEMSFGQYMGGGSTSYRIRLTEEDEGTVQVSGGYLSVAGWGATGDAHKKLTRNSMSGYGWSGGDNPNLDYGKLAYIPGFSFDVETNDDVDEVVKRNAGLLKALKVNCNMNEKPLVMNNNDIYSVKGEIARNGCTIVTVSFMNSPTAMVSAGATALKEDSKLYLRYWVGDDKENSQLMELKNADIIETTDSYGGKGYSITSQAVLHSNILKNSIYANMEIIVVPDEGYPMTYSRMASNATAPLKTPFPLLDLQIHAAEGSGSLGRFDGILEADDLTYTDESGNTAVQDLGYGFVATEDHFTTEVPNGTDKIYLSAEALSAARGTNCAITVNGGSETYAIGDEIPLNVGKNELAVVYTAKNGKKDCVPRTYTIDVTRRTAAKQTSFELPEGASVLVMQGSKVVKANEDGTYTLENGTYTYYVSKSGYLTKHENFEVTDENPSLTIRVDELEPVPEQSGSVSVQLSGQSTVFCPGRSVEIQQAAADLAANRYVQYNHGGYTVLHALLDAAKASNTEFECSKGKFVLTDQSISDSNGKRAVWICKVNGVVCSDPANTLAKDGDQIEFYYSSGWNGMIHAHLTPETGSVKRGEELKLTLTGTGVYDADESLTPVAEAEIYEGNTLLGTTDDMGVLELNTRTLTLGDHRFTAVKKDEAGHNLLTAVMSTVTVKKADNTSADPNTTVVTFRLIGDTKHGDASDDHAYTTWIATDTYTFDRTDVTVGDVFEAALGEAGLTYEGKENNYVSSITAPESCGGFALAEKENGPNSGWMYTVNGKHPDVGLNDCYVTTGDEIIWHYIDDYKTEQADMMGDMGPGGDPSTWNKWLEALDETPGARDAAAEVVGKINAIGTVELTDECEAAITDARTAYDSLTREQKKYVDNYTTLTAAEKELAAQKKAAEDQAAADEVIRMITELPSVDDLTLDDQSKVEAARTAYGNLTEEQKKLVDAYNDGTTMDSLTKAEERIAKLLEEEAADQVADEIDNLPSVDDLTIEDKSAVESAKAHYDALNDDQKDRVEEQKPGSAEKLEKLVERMEELKAAAADQEAADKVSEKLNALPAAEDVMLASEDEIKAARDAFDALTEAQQGKVSEEAKAKLTDAEAKLSELQNQLKNAADLIGALPNTSEITLAHEDQIKAARDAYDALNNEQKNKLTEDGTLSKLLEAENQLTYVKNNAEAAKKAEDRINSLPNPGDLKMSDKSRVEAARDAYDALTDEQKDLIPKDTYDKLKDCEAEMKNLVDAPVITLKDKKTGVSVTGKLSGYELVVTPLQKTDDAVIRMKELLGTKETLTCLYDVKLYLNGQEVQPRDTITLNFKVGSKYSNKTLRIFHDHNGLIEELEESVKAGVLSLDVDSLSPFGIVVKKSTTTNNSGSGSHSGSHSSSGSDSSSAASTAASTAGTTAQGTPADTSTVSRTGGAKTGDDTDFFFPIVGMLTATGALAGILFIYKKKKTEEES